MTTIRLAMAGPPEALARGLRNVTRVYLAHVHGAQGDNVLQGTKGVPQVTVAPSLLVSYVYLDLFLKNRYRYNYRDWALDSGAFSAWKSGAKIDLQAYIDTCGKLLEEDPTLTEVFGLDAIGDWQTTARNVEEMWKQGIPAIPTFHYGEPEEALKEMADTYPKIAIGGIAGIPGKNARKKWIGQCFARVWPKKIHGFAVGADDLIMSFPFHSVDATSWEIGPCAFGQWRSYGKLSLRGSKQDLRVEVQYFLDLERRARNRWQKEMKLLEEDPREYPVMRLVEVGSGRRKPYEQTTEETTDSI